MRSLGYPLTWRTNCFIEGGCGLVVWGHTNGYGDFVLFDDLGDPWPIHPCYELRFAIGDMTQFSMAATRSYEFAERLDKGWDEVRPILPDHMKGQRKFAVVGTVMGVERGIRGRMPQFRDAPPDASAEIARVLESRNSQIRIVTGAGEEFEAFVDTREHPVRDFDVVAVTLKARRLLSGSVFVVTSIRIFSAGDLRA